MFELSKIVGWIAAPLNLTLLLLLAALLASALRRFRLALFSGMLALAWLAVATQSPLGAVLMRPLEDRFPAPQLPAQVDGIIILGGFIETRISLARGQTNTGTTTLRLLEGARLAKGYPDARVVFSGGSASILQTWDGGAEIARDFLVDQGIAANRITLEMRSRNTHENAIYTREIVNPQPGETWIVVTSAFHMPRTVGIFRKAGWPVIPWPSDYRTAGTNSAGDLAFFVQGSDEILRYAIREWIGLVSYWFLGRTDTLFPAPEAG